MVVHDLHSLDMFLFFIYIYFSFHFDHFQTFQIFRWENFSLYIPTHIIALFQMKVSIQIFTETKKNLLRGGLPTHKKKSHDFLIRKNKFRFIFIFTTQKKNQLVTHNFCVYFVFFSWLVIYLQEEVIFQYIFILIITIKINNQIFIYQHQYSMYHTSTHTHTHIFSLIFILFYSPWIYMHILYLGIDFQ